MIQETVNRVAIDWLPAVSFTVAVKVNRYGSKENNHWQGNPEIHHRTRESGNSGQGEDRNSTRHMGSTPGHAGKADWAG